MESFLICGAVFLSIVLVGTSGFSEFVATIPFENAFLARPRALNLVHVQHVLRTSFQVSFSVRCCFIFEAI